MENYDSQFYSKTKPGDIIISGYNLVLGHQENKQPHVYWLEA